MITVQEAQHIILQQTRDYGNESVAIDEALGRILAEEIRTDRDLPPYNRVTMDGIAICHEALAGGTRSFTIKGTMAAGDIPVEIDQKDECVEIMTGGALPQSTDTVIRYEDLTIDEGTATINIETIRKGQNVHYKGKDRKHGDVVAMPSQVIDPALISMAASVGKAMIAVKKLPKVAIITTGDELVGIKEQPEPWQIRTSNNYAIRAALNQYHITPVMMHLPDDREVMQEKLKACLEQYDVLLLSGGISMGKFDFLPELLEELGVNKLFHKVKQRPGKPFWFGATANGKLAFAFPGNPVSTFLCVYRYFIPWLDASLTGKPTTALYAVLDADFKFIAPLQYFLQVKLHVNNSGQLTATPMEGNGSGDFANLLESDAFMELPMEKTNFNNGEVYRIWPFKRII